MAGMTAREWAREIAIEVERDHGDKGEDFVEVCVARTPVDGTILDALNAVNSVAFSRCA
jgi:hypothetical protein